MDKELVILESMANDSNITQRELSKQTGISLGSINLLINKMAKEGLVKIEKANLNTIRYILTPKGIMEKSKKTYNYIKNHYSYINTTKQKMKSAIIDLMNTENDIFVMSDSDGPNELLKMAIFETGKNSKIKFIRDIDEIKTDDSILMIMNDEFMERAKQKGIKVYNIMERI